jgi:DNA-binding transcriptional ArsR family regulator
MVNGKSSGQFSAMALLIGEPARATMLWKLLGGKAFTATELAISADISAQSASMHLTKLVKANLLSVVSQGRHRYYQLSGPEVAYVLESISNLVPTDKLLTEEPEQVNQNDIKFCRTCYDHLAGRVGVAVTDRMVEKKIIAGSGKHNYEVTPKGIKWLADLNISANDLMKQRRAFARKCLDWSERRYHISGSLGAALFDKMIKMKWMSKQKNSRIVLLTSTGQMKLYDLLGLNL